MSLSFLVCCFLRCLVVGWIVTTGLLGQILNIQGLFIVHVVMDTILFLTWSVLIVLTITAIWKGLIFNAKDEDVLKDFIFTVDEKVTADNHSDTGTLV